MSHGICNRCGYPIAEPAPDYVRCGNAHPRIADLYQQAAEVAQRQIERAQASMLTDRRNWSQKEWIDDADRLMNEPDGAITSLVNGHVMRLLDYYHKTQRGLVIERDYDTEFGEELVYAQGAIDALVEAVAAALDVDWERMGDLETAIVRGLDSLQETVLLKGDQ